MAATQQPPPPAPPPPRIPPDVVDPPTQRLYILSLFALLQAYKLADALWPTHQPPAGLQDDLSFNQPLTKWITLDLAAVAVIAWLRVPRLDWGWKARWIARALLVALNWILFGRWTFTASVFLPGALKSLLVRSLSTAERSVRLASVYGTDKTHLGGQYTVHILAVSTAFLNPLSTVYCRHARSSHSDPTLIPLVLNNTVPSKLSYTITSFDDPPVSQQHTIPASSLVRHTSHHHHQTRHHGRRDAISNVEDDDVALASEWALVPASHASPAQQALRHRLPSDPAPQNGDAKDPFSLSPTESLYYLPITQPGSVRLDSIVDNDGHAIRIRRKRASSPSPSSSSSFSDAPSPSFEETHILRCPSAGFSLPSPSSREVHRCLAPGGPLLAESLPLGLVVAGQAQPLKVRWHAREGDPERGLRRDDALEGIVGPAEGEAEARIDVPLNVTLSRPGRTTFYLDAVTDGAGNEVAYYGGSSSSSSSASSEKAASRAPLVEGTVPSRSVVVHRPPEVAFIGDCAKGDDLPILQGKSRRLSLRLGGVEAGEQSEVEIRFVPAKEGKGWTRTIETKGARVDFDAKEEGSYEVVGVRNEWCSGAVLVPSTCTLVLQPVPTLTTHFTPLTDVCSSEIGQLATLHLTGAPPFVVHYTVTRLSSPSSNHPRSKTHSVRVPHARAEVRLEPPGPGEWEYRFTRVADRFYDGVPVQGGEFARRQKIHERGDARWRDAEKGKTVPSCEGETVQVELELSGTAPWDIEYSVVGQPPQTLKGITSSPHVLDIAIPYPIAQHGGQFALSLESVRDGNGCKRPLAVGDLQVDVKRTKPTARFAGAEGRREIVIRQGEAAKIPLRLTGESPWEVTYQPPSRDSTPLKPITVTAKQANVDINISDAVAGTYKLLSVRDHYCPGDVSETDWKVATLPRPTLRLGDNLGTVARNGSVIRPGVCANVADSVPVYFSGKAPFKASYTLTKGSHHGEAKQHTLQSIQNRAELTLFTAAPGHHTYTFGGVGDSLYTSPAAAGLEAPKGGKSGVVRVEQDVFALPTAFFGYGAKHGFCVSDELASRAADDLVLHLTGLAPFEVELEVREDGPRGAAKRFVVPSIAAHSWPLSLPFALKKAAPHSVALRRVKDAHGCETLVDPSALTAAASGGAAEGALVRGGGGGGRTTVTLPVAEIATITPVSPQADHCVGDFLDFVVQGAPPFTVQYEFEGKRHAASLTGGKFQRVADRPGTFRVVSVGHGEEKCRSNHVDIVKQVHPIPSARVNTGDSVVVDLREGEQTEIVFVFDGTPPFSFTYSRRAPQDRSKDRTVLETHTVTGIQERQYSIFTSQEGTWSVSYIADAFCSYPPAQKSAVVKA
ncbi:hypothetical protein JCM10207_001391 [Rhodosporidiobolus poonsookiae]